MELTTPLASAEATITLNFRTHPIRTIEPERVLWFCLPDLLATFRQPPDPSAVVSDLAFPQFACRSYADPEGGEITAISAIGIFYLTEIVDRFAGQALSSWARREQQRLVPDPTRGDPNVFLTMLPDHCLPPRPGIYSGYLNEWQALRFSAAGMKEVGRWPACYAPVYQRFKDAEDAIMRRVVSEASTQRIRGEAA